MKYLIELSDNELQLISEEELRESEQSAEEFDGFTGHTIKALVHEIDIHVLEARRFVWSQHTFPEATAQSSLEKLKSEIKEIEQDLINNKPDPLEYADALMCLFDSAGRAGVSVEQIFSAFADKLAINQKRTWKKNPDNSYSHIKTPTNE